MVQQVAPRYFVCHDDDDNLNKFGLEGEYKIQWTQGVPHYLKSGKGEAGMDRVLYWDSTRGDWIVGWDIDSHMGYFYSHDFEWKASSWYLDSLAPQMSKLTNVHANSLTVSKFNTCNLPPRLYVCDAPEEYRTTMNFVEDEPLRLQTEFVNGAPYYKGATSQSNVFVFWAKGSWLVGSSTWNNLGYFKGAFNDVGDLTKGSWLKSTDAVAAGPMSNHWEPSKIKLSTAECSQSFYSTSEPTTSAAETTETTMMASTTTSATYAADCSENIDIKWVESTAALEFYGETSALVSVSLTSVDQFTGGDIDLNVATEPYVGFLIYRERWCGSDFLKALSSNMVSWSIVDKGSFYKSQSTFKYRDTVILQLERHDSSNNDIVTSEGDKLHLVFDGIDKTTFLNNNMAECLENIRVGVANWYLTNFGGDDTDFSVCAALDYENTFSP